MYQTIIIFRKETTEEKLNELKNVVKVAFRIDKFAIHYSEESLKKIILDGDADMFGPMQMANIALSKNTNLADSLVAWCWLDNFHPGENCDLLALYNLRKPKKEKVYFKQKEREYIYTATIVLKKSTPDEIVVKLTNLIETTFGNKSGAENISKYPRKFVFQGRKEQFGTLQAANIELYKSDLFKQYIKVWHWDDCRSEAESCDLLEVYSSVKQEL